MKRIDLGLCLLGWGSYGQLVRHQPIETNARLLPQSLADDTRCFKTRSKDLWWSSSELTMVICRVWSSKPASFRFHSLLIPFPTPPDNPVLPVARNTPTTN
ncbi:hypothetical protein P175DRAFT_0558292 [Aspergillus ochraceoroseus IBT 24754]|uniref:Uncharacterized protein n=1 Tax=Aspergillus ochraceoroseus IBT 24754 TaxID=1392256 RepID=A0A2T5LV06_9EURO|nr:uncharacterized protein P175DRAFT_0558292 [Aspergillus ochraceoroseus IBT 24754]PTU20107.1 hypothetical protein P175DRAFT_0558292 [Aspergillus ochraceoroseus IBT 24754]